MGALSIWKEKDDPSGQQDSTQRATSRKEPKAPGNARPAHVSVHGRWRRYTFGAGACAECVRSIPRMYMAGIVHAIYASPAAVAPHHRLALAEIVGHYSDHIVAAFAQLERLTDESEGTLRQRL